MTQLQVNSSHVKAEANGAHRNQLIEFQTVFDTRCSPLVPRPKAMSMSKAETRSTWASLMSQFLLPFAADVLGLCSTSTLCDSCRALVKWTKSTRQLCYEPKLDLSTGETTNDDVMGVDFVHQQHANLPTCPASLGPKVATYQAMGQAIRSLTKGNMLVPKERKAPGIQRT